MPDLLNRSLRPLAMSDHEALLPLLQDAVALQYEDYGPFDPNIAKDYLAQRLRVAATSGLSLNAIVVNGVLAGFCQLEFPTTGPIGSWGTVGYGILPTLWGCGHATWAVGALELRARELEAKGLRAVCDSFNTSSIRVLQKCGWRETGMVAELEPVKGRYRDMLRWEKKFG